MTSDPLDAEQLRAQLYEKLPAGLRDAVLRVVNIGASGREVYLVGGAVRDLLLGRVIADIDLTTEADAPAVARQALPDADVTTHARFRTASVQIGEHRIDLTTSRRETYAHPGALPDVEPAPISEDLLRRDFTVNALALRLNGHAVLLDPADGRDDLRQRQVRVLHDNSFRDDATRIFRAFRYASRLQFQIEAHTQERIEADIAFIETIGGERLRYELHLLFEEESGASALESLDAAGALRAIHPSLGWSDRRTQALASAQMGAFPRTIAGIVLLASSADEQAEQVVTRLQLDREEAEAVRGVAALALATETLRRPTVKPSGVVTVLDRYPSISVAVAAALTDDAAVRHVCDQYLQHWRDEKPILSGNDLREMGIPEGPQIGKGLQLIRAARLDGWATDRDDERALVLRFAKSIRDSRAMNQPIDFKQHGY